MATGGAAGGVACRDVEVESARLERPELTARQRARMADLSLLLDVIISTTSPAAKQVASQPLHRCNGTAPPAVLHEALSLHLGSSPPPRGPGGAVWGSFRVGKSACAADGGRCRRFACSVQWS